MFQEGEKEEATGEGAGGGGGGGGGGHAGAAGKTRPGIPGLKTIHDRTIEVTAVRK